MTINGDTERSLDDDGGQSSQQEKYKPYARRNGENSGCWDKRCIYILILHNAQMCLPTAKGNRIFGTIFFCAGLCSEFACTYSYCAALFDHFFCQPNEDCTIRFFLSKNMFQSCKNTSAKKRIFDISKLINVMKNMYFIWPNLWANYTLETQNWMRDPEYSFVAADETCFEKITLDQLKNI